MAAIRLSGFIKEIDGRARSADEDDHDIPLLKQYMPHIVQHSGCWKGIHSHIGIDGKTLGEHESLVECIFPTEGFVHYIHKEKIRRSDNKRETDFAEAIFQDGRLWLQNEKFEGSVSESESGIILFDLVRRDKQRWSVKEMVSLGKGGEVRSRAIQWFEYGRLVKRSLCNEERVG